MKRANFWTSFKKVKASYALQSAWNSLCWKWIVIRSGLKFHIKFVEFYFKSTWVKEVMSLIPLPHQPLSLFTPPFLPVFSLFSFSFLFIMYLSLCLTQNNCSLELQRSTPPLSFHKYLSTSAWSITVSALFSTEEASLNTRDYHPLPPQKIN